MVFGCPTFLLPALAGHFKLFLASHYNIFWRIEVKSTALEGPALSREIIVAIHDNEFLEASGNYGDLLVGDPLQYDELIIEHADGTTKIALYNRAIMLFTTTEEFYKQVHRVCCAIDKVVDAAQNL